MTPNYNEWSLKRLLGQLSRNMADLKTLILSTDAQQKKFEESQLILLEVIWRFHIMNGDKV